MARPLLFALLPATALGLASPVLAQQADASPLHPHQHQHETPAPDPTAISPGPNMETPPPPEAGSGPPRAADAIWGAEVMQGSRHQEHGAHGASSTLWVQADRLESHVRQGRDGYLWDLQGYYGGPTNRLWLKSEGEGAFGEKVEDAEVQALWSKAVLPYWDLQIGARQDVGGPNTSHAVIGFQGLAPYFFEVDAAAFLSHRGDVTARLEAELDQRITQRLIVQPRAELNLAAQDIPELGIGAGVDKIELGLRLRYEVIREFAPYIGIEQIWRTGASAAFTRQKGEDPSTTSLVLGVRFWF
ncbi:MAG: copper resistance protein B [Chakrabartia sp.]